MDNWTLPGTKIEAGPAGPTKVTVGTKGVCDPGVAHNH